MTDIINPMSRGSVACSRYLKWIHEETLGSYGAWVPSRQRIDPGDIGYFDKDKLFHLKPDQSLKAFGIEDVDFSGEESVNPSAEGSEHDFTIAVDGHAAVPFAAHSVLVKAGGRVTLRAQRSWACILQLRQATQNHITNPTKIAEDIGVNS